MGFLDRLSRALTGTTPSTVAPPPVLALSGTYELDVVGESFHANEFAQILGHTNHPKGGIRVDTGADLVLEPSNPYDQNAVAIFIGGLPVGHLAAQDAKQIAPGLRALQQTHPEHRFQCRAMIVGVGHDQCGVILFVDRARLGLPPVPEPTTLGVDSGMSAVGPHITHWMLGLPEDRLKRRRQLVALLVNETHPLSRHFLHNELEDVLYGLRNDVPDALDAYDQTVTAHHAELVAVGRAALIGDIGALPRLPLYRQAAIREAAAGNLQAALAWAQAGLAMYGTDAYRTEWVDDLNSRAAKLSAKLSAPPKPAPKPRTPRLAAPPAAAGDGMETLTCHRCGQAFTRERTRGRKPHHCPDCQPTTT